jgi:hypothetical protein
VKPHNTPRGVTRWQDPSPPILGLRAKADRYQERLEVHHRTPEGLIRYRRSLGGPPDPSYGDLADGCFHTGIYLASQALRHAATRDPRAREEALHALRALEMLMEVTGKPGLLARHFSPAGTISGGPWRASSSLPAYVWRSDVSKDQYAGFIHGLGVALVCLDEPEVRARVARLAGAAADHLLANDFTIIDADGEPTTHGDLGGRFLFLPIGVNALITLAIAKVAAVATGEERHQAFYRRLIANGYHHVAHWAYFDFLGVGNRVNDHMGYLALYPLLRLEEDPRIAAVLRDGGRRTWRHVRGDRNAFFAFIHAAAVGDPPGDPPPAAFSTVEEALSTGRESLGEFPEEKIEWPVDLTRPGFDFPRAFLNSRKCEPRTTSGIPLYLRVRTSSLWASDPFRLAGRLLRYGEVENAGMDYLVAYWLGRYHGFIAAEE